jgi:hypothetical protein
MRKFAGITLALAICIIFTAPQAKALNIQDITNVLTANAYNWLRDDDGDGIPNCLDDNYVPPLDGTGYGYCGGDEDTYLESGTGFMRDDDGDGTPNGDDEDWIPPLDGSGYGYCGTK